jgi:hypothetical protein
MKRNFYNVCAIGMLFGYITLFTVTVKRKWEKIVSRGFDKNNAGNDRVTNTSANGQGGAMLEGIKEGVQGVSRFIAAGLAIGELPSPSSYQSQTTRPVGPSHLTNQSNSSVSTCTTKSTRLSQSSVSSIGEDPTISTPEKDGEVLMVHDTGATPTMSPNPAFMHQQEQQRNQVHESPRSSLDAEDDFFSANIGVAKAHRRKSQDASIPKSPWTSPVSPISSFPAESSSVRQTARGKRISINGLPPVSSIPGLGSLTASATSQPVSSWVGSVGKKWEELQRGSTYTSFLLFYVYTGALIGHTRQVFKKPKTCFVAHIRRLPIDRLRIIADAFIIHDIYLVAISYPSTIIIHCSTK